jgi:hypothetical protein
MSEPLRRPLTDVAEVGDPILELLPPLTAVEANDNEATADWRGGERIGFQVPPAIWGAMVACYAVFLAALLAATGGAHAAFAIAVSAIYVAMFFGVSRVLLRQGPEQPRSPLARSGGMLQTHYGPLGRREVIVQMLVVPMLIAFFGLAVLVIRLVVM